MTVTELPTVTPQLSSTDDDEIPQELLLGKHQLSELASESAKIKAMGITFRVTKGNTMQVDVNLFGILLYFSHLSHP